MDVQTPLLVVGVVHNSSIALTYISHNSSSSAGTGVYCAANISGLPLTHSGGILYGSVSVHKVCDVDLIYVSKISHFE